MPIGRSLARFRLSFSGDLSGSGSLLLLYPVLPPGRFLCEWRIRAARLLGEKQIETHAFVPVL